MREVAGLLFNSAFNKRTWRSLNSTAFQHLIKQEVENINLVLDRPAISSSWAVQRNNLEHVNFCREYGTGADLGTYAQVWTALANAVKLDALIAIVGIFLRFVADFKVVMPHKRLPSRTG